MIWNSYDRLNKFYSFYLATVVIIVSRNGLSIDMCHRNQDNKSKLVLYKPLFHYNSYLKQLYISNKIECFIIKLGVVYRGIVHISKQ